MLVRGTGKAREQLLVTEKQLRTDRPLGRETNQTKTALWWQGENQPRDRPWWERETQPIRERPWWVGEKQANHRPYNFWEDNQ